MLKYLIPIALLATPAAAQEFESTLTIVNMQIAYDRCGLAAPKALTYQVAGNSMKETRMDGNTLADRIEKAADVLGEQMEREGTLGQFCARMATIYAGLQ